MQICNRALGLIKEFEGCSLKSYKCPAGVWTAGFGSTGKDIGPKTVWTQEQADARLLADLAKFEAGVEAAAKAPNIRQFSAMVMLAYNIGLEAFKSSTLLKKFNAGDHKGASYEFVKWNKAAGKELAGLTRRRLAERDLFISA